jgi:hypothetical protein
MVCFSLDTADRASALFLKKPLDLVKLVKLFPKWLEVLSSLIFRILLFGQLLVKPWSKMVNFLVKSSV